MGYFESEFNKEPENRNTELWSDDEMEDYFANLRRDEEEELFLGEI